MWDLYDYVRVMGPGLIILEHPKYGSQIWSFRKVRKYKECIVTKEDLQGKEAYAPITNKANRGDRISEEGMNMIKQL